VCSVGAEHRLIGGFSPSPGGQAKTRPLADVRRLPMMDSEFMDASIPLVMLLLVLGLLAIR